MWNVPDINAINYFSFVDEILTNDDLFATFKENHTYNAIVGMSCEAEGEWFANNLKDNNSINLKIEEFKKNDSIGEPAVFDSKEYGFISPNTLRYLNSLQNIQKYIGSLHKKNIVEVGIGYGGLCYILSTFYNLNSYKLVDVPNVTLLAVKYLRALGLNTNLMIERDLKNIRITDIVSQSGRRHHINFAGPSYDLLISEYCISEMDDDGIDHFYENYIQHSKNIYIFSNLWDKKRKEQFLSKLGEKFNLTVFDDPLPHETKICPEKMNYIIMGKRRL
ncbi:MAG TPA: hypothetical protein DCG52_06585 [Alphaproteobacteria bacterium]|nr:hypothetical protein [Alphaproteobacteria bacterium]|tara:strand:+ start:852 stop:1682 length:831 start_codon:yes stop_codon:yes gene_type:complete